MSGIIDNKSRMLDTILTLEGRRQMAQGKLRVEFAVFTDGETFYKADINSGSADASDRIMFEACSLPQDQITFEADDSGRLVPYHGSPLGIIDGKILSGSSDAFLSIVTGSAFASTAGSLLDSSINNFEKMMAIGTADYFFDDEKDFTLNTNQVEFKVSDTVPFKKKSVVSANVDKIEALFQDKRLSNVTNFMYLPPVNRALQGDATGTPLGDYPVIGQRRTPLTLDDIKLSLANCENKLVDFTQTTLKSNVMAQLFELKQHSLLKLDVIDFGVVDDPSDPNFPEKHVFFAGRVFIDSMGAQTFVNIFTLIYS